jgi:hypothetical protein
MEMMPFICSCRNNKSEEGEESEGEESEGEESEGEESDLFKYEVLDIRFPVDNGEKAPDPSMRELVMGRVWKAMDEAGVWEAVTEAITKEVGWLCEGVCERIVESEDEVVAAAMAAVK